jgi:hypothetical protein
MKLLVEGAFKLVTSSHKSMSAISSSNSSKSSSSKRFSSIGPADADAAKKKRYESTLKTSP